MLIHLWRSMPAHTYMYKRAYPFHLCKHPRGLSLKYPTRRDQNSCAVCVCIACWFLIHYTCFGRRPQVTGFFHISLFFPCTISTTTKSFLIFVRIASTKHISCICVHFIHFSMLLNFTLWMWLHCAYFLAHSFPLIPLLLLLWHNCTDSKIQTSSSEAQIAAAAAATKFLDKP